MRRLVQTGVLFAVGFAATMAIVSWPRYAHQRDRTIEMAEAHVAHQTSHPGWSFPARVWSDAVPVEGTPPARFVAHAEARGYTRACPPTQPGEICPDDGAVILRGGVFAEGVQPPGNVGWSRPLALEPKQIGTLIGPDAEVRTHLPVVTAPDHLVAAILAAEDTAFYEHSGVNLKGVIRAAWVNLSGRGRPQGASTLSMQVVRNLSQDKERTWRRKLREMVSARTLDAHLGKQGVLQAYLDAPYLGQAGSLSICGFEAASQYYWNKPAAALSLGEAATLAGILPAPGRYGPDRHPEAAKARRDLVLGRMATLGWDVEAALAEPVQANPTDPLEVLHPAYLQSVRQWLETAVPTQTLYGAGLDVFTGLDLVAQTVTEDTLSARIAYLEKQVGRRGEAPLETAGVLIDPDSGLLVAVYGGRVLRSTDFNRATQARRQSGSSIKPLVYAMAFSQSDAQGKPTWTAADTVPNAPRTFPGTNGWRPRNVGGEYSQTATLAYGLSWSQNIATASLLEEVGGPEAMIEWAGRMGFDTSAWPAEMGLALGQGESTPLEMARFAATMLGGGKLASGRPVRTAIDAAGVVRVPPPAPGAQVVGPEAAALTRDLMRLVIEYGTGGAARGAAAYAGYPGPAIGKTGTTDSEKDLWFVGGTAHHAAALWVGYDQPTRIGASASDISAPLWGWWMRAVTKDLDRMAELPGAELLHKGVCTQSGKWGNGGCRLVGAPFLEGTTPKGVCSLAHPPPDPDKKAYESLWKRKAREKEEAEAAEAAGAPAEG